MANSYSSMETFEKCPFSYKLRYVDGHYVYSDSLATEFGTAIHKCEEEIALSIMENKPINYVKIKNNFLLEMYRLQDKYRLEFFSVDKSNKTYYEKQFYYLSHGVYRLEEYMKNHPSYQILGAEVKFNNVEISGNKFKGAIDRVIYDTASGEYIIQDVKSWPVLKEEDDLKGPLQFVVYAKALEQLYGCSLDKLHFSYDLPICDAIQEAGADGFIQEGEKKLEEIFNDISNNKFKPKLSPLCHWCSFCSTNKNIKTNDKYWCPYGSIWTEDNKVVAPMMKFTSLENYDFDLEVYLQSFGLKLSEDKKTIC